MTIDTRYGKIPPPPRLLNTIGRGFDSIANHIVVILPPLLLDLFLWLGPRLRLQALLQPFINNLPTLAGVLPSGFPNLETIQQTWRQFASQFNLFSILRTFPVGSTSLLSLMMPDKNPLGNVLGLDAGSLSGVLIWVVLLVFLGWVIGALYIHWVSGVTLKPDARSLWNGIRESILLSLIWTALLLIVGVPALLIISVVTALSPALGQLVLLAGGLLLIWLLMPIFFSVHGIFTLQLGAFQAILRSLNMVRFTLPNTGLFLLFFLAINQVMNFLWNTPAQDSWWLLVGIAGHAFISTALLAASFVYYRDINAWLKVVFETLQKQKDALQKNGLS